MLNSRNRENIRRLFYGDISGYLSQSEADLALCAHLAFWTQHDEERVDRLFRRSKLMREKWDKEEYRRRTIQTALENQQYDFDPKTPKEDYSLSATPLQAELPLGNTKCSQVADYLKTGFAADTEHFSECKSRKTGYSNIDAITSLYPGLYTIGAVTSLGKTTFAQQMADQLAREGEHVLYFTLEQSIFELVSKGLSRITAQNDLRNAICAIKIREGLQSPILQNALQQYMSFSSHISIYECGFDTSVGEIITHVQEYIRANGIKPVVFIDYLQIIRPLDSRMSTKDAVDNNVRALKKLQLQNGLVVIVISSLNRQNYLSPIDFESFKESGGIEYTADVVWGLQLSIMNDTDFISIKNLTEKREAVKQAKAEHPSKVELVCLKNRFGTSSYSCSFNYYAMFDYFAPCGQAASSSSITNIPSLEGLRRIDIFDQLSGRKATFGR